MSTPMTIAEFDVALQDLQDAAASIKGEHTNITAQTQNIYGWFSLLANPANWSSPAQVSFGDLERATSEALLNLSNLLDEMVGRMQTAYQNYHDAELDNFSNMNGK